MAEDILETIELTEEQAYELAKKIKQFKEKLEEKYINEFKEAMIILKERLKGKYERKINEKKERYIDKFAIILEQLKGEIKKRYLEKTKKALVKLYEVLKEKAKEELKESPEFEIVESVKNKIKMLIAEEKAKKEAEKTNTEKEKTDSEISDELRKKD